MAFDNNLEDIVRKKNSPHQIFCTKCKTFLLINQLCSQSDNSYVESQAVLPLDKFGEEKKKQRNTSECKLQGEKRKLYIQLYIRSVLCKDESFFQNLASFTSFCIFICKSLAAIAVDFKENGWNEIKPQKSLLLLSSAQPRL